MFFRFPSMARSLELAFEQDAYKFHFNEPFMVEVTMRPAGPDHSGMQEGNVEFCVEFEREPNAVVHSMFEQLSRGELPPGYGSEAPEPLRPIADLDGKPRRLRPQVVFMPKPFQDFVNGILPPTFDPAKRVFDVLRWRFDRRGAGCQSRFDEYKFSFDRDIWHRMPSMSDPLAAVVIYASRYQLFGQQHALAISSKLKWVNRTVGA
jgi:hypothetical protein